MIDVIGISRLNQLRTRLLPPMPMTRGLNELGGSIKFYIGVNITGRELSQWSPQRITDFFQGIAQVIGARGTPR